MYSDKIKYVGCDDADLDLFESQYDLPEGMCYNSYLLLGEKIAVMDTVDRRMTAEWLTHLTLTLDGKKPDYLVVHHVEPDHSGSLGAFLQAYPETATDEIERFASVHYRGRQAGLYADEAVRHRAGKQTRGEGERRP